MHPTHSHPPLPPRAPQYGATSVALAIYSLPLFWQRGGGLAPGSQGELTQNYISSMRLLSNTSK